MEFNTEKFTNKQDQTHTIFLILGKTASGKDSLVNEICDKMGLKQLCSYTTRPRRENEGDTHVFIDKSDVHKYIDDIVAYTKIGEYEYFGTHQQLEESDVYIIDYVGVKSLREYYKNHPGKGRNMRFVPIYINTPDAIRKYRAINYREDNELDFYKRCFNEESQFKEMLSKQDFRYCVPNIEINKALDVLESIIKTETFDELHMM